MKITELFSFDELVEQNSAGNVSVRFHPEFPELTILNYTDQCAYKREWNKVTRLTRGLIYNSSTLEVVARPFQKIHNWDEPEAPKIMSDQIMYHWSNKEDGSLGIIFRNPKGELEVATRGSFESDQAKHATAWLREHPSLMEEYSEWMTGGFTPLVEIVYPENRIVLDYAGRDELIPLGSVYIQDGSFIPYKPSGNRTFHELLLDCSRSNAEGWVAWLTPWKAVKIKQADYVELHKIVTGLNRKTVWQALREGKFDSLVQKLPDEFYEWTDGVRNELERDHRLIRQGALDTFKKVRDLPTRKDQAIFLKTFAEPHIMGLVFGLLDGKDITDSIWNLIEPKGGEK